MLLNPSSHEPPWVDHMVVRCITGPIPWPHGNSVTPGQGLPSRVNLGPPEIWSWFCDCQREQHNHVGVLKDCAFAELVSLARRFSEPRSPFHQEPAWPSGTEHCPDKEAQVRNNILYIHTPEEAQGMVSHQLRIKWVICGHSKGTLLGRSPASVV